MIHVNRLRPLKPQTLSGEILKKKGSCEGVDDNKSEFQETEDTMTICPDSALVSGRPLRWYEDYVLYCVKV